MPETLKLIHALAKSLRAELGNLHMEGIQNKDLELITENVAVLLIDLEEELEDAMK